MTNSKYMHVVNIHIHSQLDRHTCTYRHTHTQTHTHTHTETDRHRHTHTQLTLSMSGQPALAVWARPEKAELSPAASLSCRWTGGKGIILSRPTATPPWPQPCLGSLRANERHIQEKKVGCHKHRLVTPQRGPSDNFMDLLNHYMYCSNCPNESSGVNALCLNVNKSRHKQPLLNHNGWCNNLPWASSAYFSCVMTT